MNMYTEKLYWKTDLVLRDDKGFSVTIPTFSSVLARKSNNVIDCRLILQIDSEIYQYFDKKSLLNLRPEVRGPFFSHFLPGVDIEVEAFLEPNLLPEVQAHAASAEAFAQYLQQLSQGQPDHPLLSTHSWYALQVRQQQEGGETGYFTLWKYVKPSMLDGKGIPGEQIATGMANFIQNWEDASQLGTMQTDLSETIEKMTMVFEEMTGNLSEMTEKTVSETLAAVSGIFEELTEELSEALEEVASEQPIFEIVAHFLKDDDWPFTQVGDEIALETAFQGQNGRWICYANAREEQQQFVFYSICPIFAPEDQRSAIAHFLTLANYGMTIGNFELDYTDGEIRYKTSIDVEGDRLTPALIKRLVYTNVAMMDQYLPGIHAIINDRLTPEAAIQTCESDTSSSSTQQEQ
jgi:hypothetical protein